MIVFTSTVDYRRNVYVAARPERPVAARVNPNFGSLGERVSADGYQLAWSLRWTDRPKTGIVSDSQRPCLHCFVYGTRCPRSYAPVAQWIEYCPPKAGVAGSIPAGRTNLRTDLGPQRLLRSSDFQGPCTWGLQLNTLQKTGSDMSAPAHVLTSGPALGKTRCPADR